MERRRRQTSGGEKKPAGMQMNMFLCGENTMQLKK